MTLSHNNTDANAYDVLHYVKTETMPTNKAHLLALAEYYRESKIKSVAIEVYEKALALCDSEEERIEILHQMGLYCIYVDEDAEAALRIFLAIENQKPSFLVLFIIGYCYYQRGGLQEALQYARRSFDVQPGRDAAVLILYCLQELKDHQQYKDFGNFIAEMHPAFQINHLSPVKENNPERPNCRFALCTIAKSGTVYISSILSNMLQIPTYNLSYNTGMGMIENTIKNVSKGGAMGHGHIYPSMSGFELFEKYSIDRFIVHIRDPRQAIVSWFYHADKVQANYGARPALKHSFPEDYFSWDVDRKKDYVVYELFRNWYRIPDEWHTYCETNPHAHVLFTCFETMRDNESVFFSEILDFLGESVDRSEFQFRPNISKTHHRKGSSDCLGSP